MNDALTNDRDRAKGFAVLVIDMQNGFLHPDGSLPRAGVSVPDADAVIAENRRLLAEARARALPIIYTQHIHRPDFIEVPARRLARLPTDPRPLVRGSWDAQIVDELKPESGDYVVEKCRYDAFLYTDLEVVLRGLGVQRLLVSGVVTSVCVESSVRSGEQRDFEMLVAADCCSGPRPLHDASLTVMATHFAEVAPWQDLLDRA
jgi:ureidoacrylate peracid hydrolase